MCPAAIPSVNPTTQRPHLIILSQWAVRIEKTKHHRHKQKSFFGFHTIRQIESLLAPYSFKVDWFKSILIEPLFFSIIFSGSSIHFSVRAVFLLRLQWWQGGSSSRVAWTKFKVIIILNGGVPGLDFPVTLNIRTKGDYWEPRKQTVFNDKWQFGLSSAH